MEARGADRASISGPYLRSISPVCFSGLHLRSREPEGVGPRGIGPRHAQAASPSELGHDCRSLRRKLGGSIEPALTHRHILWIARGCAPCALSLSRSLARSLARSHSRIARARPRPRSRRRAGRDLPQSRLNLPPLPPPARAGRQAPAGRPAGWARTARSPQSPALSRKLEKSQLNLSSTPAISRNLP